MAITRATASSLIQGLPKRKSVLADNLPILAGSYESIATYTLSSSQTSITFSAIPSTFKHLQIRAISRSNYSTGTGGGIENYCTFNSDTSANYVTHNIYGTGSTAGAGASTSQTAMVVGYSARSGDTANAFGTYVTDILDYTSTNKNKVIRSLAGEDYNGSGTIRFWSGLWLNTTAITSITITCLPSNSFVQYSQFALYGIRG